MAMGEARDAKKDFCDPYTKSHERGAEIQRAG